MAKVGLAKVGLAKVGWITMAKVGLAKVGFDLKGGVFKGGSNQIPFGLKGGSRLRVIKRLIGADEAHVGTRHGQQHWEELRKMVAN